MDKRSSLRKAHVMEDKSDRRAQAFVRLARDVVQMGAARKRGSSNCTPHGSGPRSAEAPFPENAWSAARKFAKQAG